MTPDQIFDAFTEQIMQCHFEAVRQGLGSPKLRSVMTWKTKEKFLRHKSFQRFYATACSPPTDHRDFDFRGSLVDVIPGDDYFFHTRCTNLPES